MIKKRIVWYVHLGTPCCVWSRARHGIRDFRKARRKEAVGLAAALFSAKLIRMCLSHGVKFSLENPAGSRLWQFGPIASIFHCKSVLFVQWDMCAYKTPYKKTTGLLTNIPELIQLGHRCPRNHRHEHLVGTERVGVEGRKITRNRTSGAGAYPPGLCAAWAQVLRTVAPPEALGKTGWTVSNCFLQDLWDAAGKVESPLSKDAASTCSEDRHSKNPVIREAKRYVQCNPVVFGQFTKEDIQRELRKGNSNRQKEEGPASCGFVWKTSSSSS